MSDYALSKQHWDNFFIQKRQHIVLEELNKNRFFESKFFESKIEYFRQHIDGSPYSPYIGEPPYSPTEELVAFRVKIDEMYDDLERNLTGIPNTIEKAKGALVSYVQAFGETELQALEIACIVKDQLTEQDIDRIVVSLKTKKGKYVEWQNQTSPVVTEKFGADESFWELVTLNDFSVYRFLETFKRSELNKMKGEIEDRFFTSVEQEYLRNLWLISRSPSLQRAVLKTLHLALEAALTRQSSEGWWNIGRDTVGHRIEHTAMLTFALLKLGTENAHRAAAERGIHWLARNSSANGFWGGVDDSGQEEESNLLNSITAISSIRLGNLPGFESLIKSSETWILAQQDPRGLWSHNQFFTEIQMTSLVVDYFEFFPPVQIQNHLLKSARDFIQSGSNQITVDSGTSIRLGIIAIYHGLEFFLYACLQEPGVNIKILAEGNETIGFRKALTSLQTHFQSKKILKSSEIIEYRNQMDRLALRRDGVIHRAEVIAALEANELYESAVLFVNLNCKRIFNSKLL
jgi:hypothetical protein